MFYLCEHNACVIRQQELDFTDARYICEKTGIWTRDGILWFSSSGEEIEPPDSVTFHIWTAYSPFTTWVQIVKDWMKTKGDTGKRKTFVNTTLGETWEAKIGERPDAEVMAERKEHYSAPVILNTVLTLLLQALIRTLYRVLLQAQVHTHILWVLVLIRTPLRLVHMDTPSPLTLLVTRKTPSKTSHLTIL